MQVVPSVDPVSLHAELQGPNPPALLDVREPEELDISCLPAVRNIPLQDLPSHLADLDREADIVVICRVGGRSAHATAYLLQQGFKHVRNLTGGMNAWSTQVDPSIPQY